jgi:hypothetical protein
MMNDPSLVRRVAARHRRRTLRHGARLRPVATRARFVLRRLGDPETELQDVLTAFAWIVGIADGTAPSP